MPNFYSLIEYVGVAEGRFTFEMSIFQTPSFVSAYDRGSAIFVGTTVYAKIDFVSVSQLNMFVQDCYATPSNQSALRYNFINSGG
jgi:hypothetical protein